MPKFKAFKHLMIKWATPSSILREEECFEPLAVQIWVAYFIQPSLLIPNPNSTLTDIIYVACPTPDTMSLFFFLSTLIFKHLLCGNKISSFSFYTLSDIAPTASGTNRQELSDRLSVTAHRLGIDPRIFLNVSGSRIRVSGSIPLSPGGL